ncbi:hypothetical protein [Bdellovibrio sp. KM01]|uniref:hypothetical protein n=1 Tax=Bdellovibrio sp. KM01 TaxID=2748865 RepID=UPI0015E97566|nr:hypothetical protein [Bdellovibrio sp. KM01]QLY24904.1 hypothetical protein HW988_15950 [Bdellovibrio sp. KM01]
MTSKKRGPKAKPYRIIVLKSKVPISELEIARVEKILHTILVNAQEEVANDSKTFFSSILQSVV